MNDAPIKPVSPDGAVQPIRKIRLRRRSSMFQLRQWLDFVKRSRRGKQSSTTPKRGDEPAK